MTDEQTPPEWLLLEAAKRCGMVEDLAWIKRCYSNQAFANFRALCDALIAEPIKPPVDRKLLCAREAVSLWVATDDDDVPIENHAWIGVKAIELWESGYGA